MFQNEVIRVLKRFLFKYTTINAILYIMENKRRFMPIGIQMFLVFNLMGQFTQAEIHSAKGRADCVVATKERIFVFEFKLEGTAQEALAQIESREYALPYKADGRHIIKIGVAFEKDRALIKEWAVKEQTCPDSRGSEQVC